MRYYSMSHGCKVVRVSVADQHGMEHHRTVPLTQLRGRDYRDKLDAVVDAIEASISAGDPPGEVV